MKKYTLLLVALAFVFGSFSINVNSASALSLTPLYPAGCTSDQGYSPTTGVKCDTVIDMSLPSGCTSTRGYSPTTGVKCDSGSSFPPGCTSASGFSVTTGERCGNSSNFPPGCSSASGFSTTTGESCSGGTTRPQPVVNLSYTQSGTQYNFSLSSGVFDRVVVSLDCNDREVQISSTTLGRQSCRSFTIPLRPTTGIAHSVRLVSKDSNIHYIGVSAEIYFRGVFLGRNEIQVPVYPANTTTRLTASSSEIVNSQSRYTPGQTIHFSVRGTASNGRAGTPEQGFNVQAYIQDSRNTVQVNGVYQSVNATYNYGTSLWDVVMTAPSDNSETYKVGTGFYCSNSNAGCSNSQIDKSFTFSLSSGSSTCSSSGYDTRTGFRCGCSSTFGYSSHDGLSCGSREVVRAPVISSISPTMIYNGDTVTVYGSNFVSSSTVTIDGSVIHPTIAGSTRLSFSVPQDTTIGTHELKVMGAPTWTSGGYFVGGEPSNSLSFSVLPRNATVSCSAILMNNSTLSAGQNSSIAITSNPVGLRAYLHGTRNGQTDTAHTVMLGTTDLTQTYRMELPGNYTRYFVLKDTSGNTVCTTSTLNMTVTQ